MLSFTEHFYLLVKMCPADKYSDDEIKERYVSFHGDAKTFPVEKAGILSLREKWSSLSEFVKEVKQTFSRFCNMQHNRRGTL
jgi:putative transposase